MAGKENYTAAQFIKASPGTGGIITAIAGRVGCNWYTARKYITQYPTVARAYEDECERMTDLAESTILTAIKGGDASTAKWYLTMKGAGRGYAPTNKQEISGADGKPLTIEVSYSEPGSESDD